MKKAFCSVIFSMTRLYETVLTSDLNFPSYLSGQKGTSGNISQPRPVHFSASASKNFPLVPFLSTSVTQEKLKSEVKTVSYSHIIEKNGTKYYFCGCIFFFFINNRKLHFLLLIHTITSKCFSSIKSQYFFLQEGNLTWQVVLMATLSKLYRH